MSVFIVTWNLNKEGDKYAAARASLLKLIDQFDWRKDSGLESVRFISVRATATEISDFLKQSLDGNDRLVVTSMNKGQYDGWLDKETWDWINLRS